MLVAFNEEAYETHADEVRDGGVIIYNADDFTMTDPRSSGWRSTRWRDPRATTEPPT